MRKEIKKIILIKYCFLYLPSLFAQNKIVVFQTDFGLKDGAVSAMKGVSMGVSTDLKLFDLTHEIPAFNIWEAGYRMYQTAQYWPAGTVFVSVVDPSIAADYLRLLKKWEHGAMASVIGEVVMEHPRQVILNSNIGGRRVVNMLAGEQLPRIC